VLRRKEPDRFRPFYLKGTIPVPGRKTHMRLPLVPILGFASAGAIWLLVVFTHGVGRLLGALWILVGLGLYAFQRKKRRRASENVKKRAHAVGPSLS